MVIFVDCSSVEAPHCSKWGWCQWTSEHGSNGPNQVHIYGKRKGGGGVRSKSGTYIWKKERRRGCEVQIRYINMEKGKGEGV